MKSQTLGRVKMKVKTIAFFFAVLVSACTLEFNRDGIETYPPPSNSTTYYDVYYEMCYSEPYYHSPDWCDLYAEAECCTWYIDGWYEEWCDWNYDGCWEYSNSF